MSIALNSHLLSQNRLLSILSADEFEFLQPHLEAVSFSAKHVLFEAGDLIRYVYFPLNGMISLLSVTENGSTIEIGFSGEEGMIGLPIILGNKEMPYQAKVQVAADCFRVESKIIVNLFKQNGVFHDSSLCYLHLLFKQISQTCVCNRFHTIESRLCRWLSVMCERSPEKKLLLTQEFLAHLLGVQRTSVGMTANNLQNNGVIRYSRGRIEVIDFNALKLYACECFHIIKSEYDNFLR